MFLGCRKPGSFCGLQLLPGDQLDASVDTILHRLATALVTDPPMEDELGWMKGFQDEVRQAGAGSFSPDIAQLISSCHVTVYCTSSWHRHDDTGAHHDTGVHVQHDTGTRCTLYAPGQAEVHDLTGRWCKHKLGDHPMSCGTCLCQGRLLVELMTDRSKDASDRIAKNGALSALPDDKQHQLLAARGLLACGLLVHCLQSRHRVNHGVNR